MNFLDKVIRFIKTAVLGISYGDADEGWERKVEELSHLVQMGDSVLSSKGPLIHQWFLAVPSPPLALSTEGWLMSAGKVRTQQLRLLRLWLVVSAESQGGPRHPR